VTSKSWDATLCLGLGDGNYILIEIGYVIFFAFKNGIGDDGTTH